MHESSATLTCINSAAVMSLVLLVRMPQRSDAVESTSDKQKLIKKIMSGQGFLKYIEIPKVRLVKHKI